MVTTSATRAGGARDGCELPAAVLHASTKVAWEADGCFACLLTRQQLSVAQHTSAASMASCRRKSWATLQKVQGYATL